MKYRLRTGVMRLLPSSTCSIKPQTAAAAAAAAAAVSSKTHKLVRLYHCTEATPTVVVLSPPVTAAVLHMTTTILPNKYPRVRTPTAAADTAEPNQILLSSGATAVFFLLLLLLLPHGGVAVAVPIAVAVDCLLWLATALSCAACTAVLLVCGQCHSQNTAYKCVQNAAKRRVRDSSDTQPRPKQMKAFA